VGNLAGTSWSGRPDNLFIGVEGADFSESKSSLARAVSASASCAVKAGLNFSLCPG
jgi:hypothetical protein